MIYLFCGLIAARDKLKGICCLGSVNLRQASTFTWADSAVKLHPAHVLNTKHLANII